MKCLRCDADVPKNEIRTARRIARCRACEATLVLDEIDGELVPVSFRETPPTSLTVEVDDPPVQRGGGYRTAVEETGRFSASFRWFEPLIIFLTFFAIAWDAFLIFWYSMALRFDAGGFSIVAIVFPFAHVAVGVGLTFYVLAGWFNRTQILVEGGELRCVHGPIPWPFARSTRIRLDEVDMFVVRKAAGRRNITARWQIDAWLRSGRDVPAATGLKDEAAARYLQRKFESHL